MMIVYLIKDNTSSLVIDDVSLKDGCIPCVGTNQLTYMDDSHEFNIEPALWFKVLVATAVAIDCNRRIVRWSATEEHGSSSSDRSRMSVRERSFHGLKYNRYMSRTLYTEEHSYDYQADMDDFFYQIIELITTFQADNDEISRDKELLRIMHCYLMPTLKLNKSDLPKIQIVLKQQKDHIQKIDQEINIKNLHIEKLRNKLKEERHRLVRKFSDVTTLEGISQEYLGIINNIKKDYEEDIRKIKDRLDQEQRIVDQAKVDQLDAANLHTRRSERDLVHLKHEEMIMANENFNRASASQQNGKKKFASSMRGLGSNHKHNMVEVQFYCNVKGQLKDEWTILEQLTYKKVVMLSVKEGIKTAVVGLQACFDTSGYETDRQLQSRPTDVVRNSALIPEWRTLPQRIGETIHEKNDLIGKKHLEFVSLVNEKCEAILIEVAKQQQITPAFPLDGTGSQNDQSDTLEETCDVHSEGYVLLDKSCEPMLNELKDYVKTYTAKICGSLQKKFNLKGDANYKKIWNVYEQYFHDITIEKMLGVYKTVYENKCRELGNIKDMSPEDIGVTETYLLTVLQNEQEKMLRFDFNNISLQSGDTCSGRPVSRPTSLLKHVPSKAISDPLLQPDTKLLHKTFTEIFEEPINCLIDSLTEKSPIAKLKRLTKCVQLVSETIQCMRNESSSKRSSCSDEEYNGTSSDDLLTVIILVVTKLNHVDIARFYCDIKFLCDYMAPFMESGIHSYSLIQYVGAFQHLLDHVVVDRHSKQRSL